jgi:hypothetical protein
VAIRCARCFPCVTTKKIFASSRRADASGKLIVGEDLTYQEYPVKILDTSEKETRNNRYKMCKVQWSNHTEEEATWEKEDQLKAEFPDIFSNLSESRRRDSP